MRGASLPIRYMHKLLDPRVVSQLSILRTRDGLCSAQQSMGEQDMHKWQLIGEYTGELQKSELTEQQCAEAEDGLGFLLYDKGMVVPCRCL